MFLPLQLFRDLFLYLKNKKEGKVRFFFPFFPAKIDGYFPVPVLFSLTDGDTAAQNKDYVSQPPVHLGTAMRVVNEM